MLTISELAKTLGISYQGALKKVRTKQDELKEFLVKDDKGNIKGIEEDGLEVLRNLPHRTSYAVKKSQEQNRLESNYLKEIERLESTIRVQDEFIKELKKDKEEQKAKIISLEEELKALRGGTFFSRLLGYKK